LIKFGTRAYSISKIAIKSLTEIAVIAPCA
jgi:hypothetical protein